MKAPTPEMISKFDGIVVLSGGYELFHGPPSDLPAYLGVLGFRQPGLTDNRGLCGPICDVPFARCRHLSRCRTLRGRHILCGCRLDVGVRARRAVAALVCWKGHCWGSDACLHGAPRHARAHWHRLRNVDDQREPPSARWVCASPPLLPSGSGARARHGASRRSSPSSAASSACCDATQRSSGPRSASRSSWAVSSAPSTTCRRSSPSRYASASPSSRPRSSRTRPSPRCLS